MTWYRMEVQHALAVASQAASHLHSLPADQRRSPDNTEAAARVCRAGFRMLVCEAAMVETALVTQQSFDAYKTEVVNDLQKDNVGPTAVKDLLDMIDVLYRDLNGLPATGDFPIYFCVNQEFRQDGNIYFRFQEGKRGIVVY